MTRESALLVRRRSDSDSWWRAATEGPPEWLIVHSAAGALANTKSTFSDDGFRGLLVRMLELRSALKGTTRVADGADEKWISSRDRSVAHVTMDG